MCRLIVFQMYNFWLLFQIKYILCWYINKNVTKIKSNKKRKEKTINNKKENYIDKNIRKQKLLNETLT